MRGGGTLMNVGIRQRLLDVDRWVGLSRPSVPPPEWKPSYGPLTALRQSPRDLSWTRALWLLVAVVGCVQIGLDNFAPPSLYDFAATSMFGGMMLGMNLVATGRVRPPATSVRLLLPDAAVVPRTLRVRFAPLVAGVVGVGVMTAFDFEVSLVVLGFLGSVAVTVQDRRRARIERAHDGALVRPISLYRRHLAGTSRLYLTRDTSG